MKYEGCHLKDVIRHRSNMLVIQMHMKIIDYVITRMYVMITIGGTNVICAYNRMLNSYQTNHELLLKEIKINNTIQK